MVWVQRDTLGNINGVLANQSPGFADEELPDNDPSVMSYLANVRPQTVTQKQARLALLGAGLLDQVNAAVLAAGGAVQITWEYSDLINRTDTLIVAIGASLGLTSAQIDALFVTASTL